MTRSVRSCLAWSLALFIPASVAFGAPDIGHIYDLKAHKDGVLVATDRGLFVAATGGEVTQRTAREGGFVALAADAAHPDRLYASAPAAPLMRSDDGGRHWQAVDTDAPGPFDILTAGPAGSGRLYGVADAVYASEDGGKHWIRKGALPDKLIDLSASATMANRLYAGTMKGIQVSNDGGARWEAAGLSVLPAPLVEAMADGHLLSFEWGRGLQRARESGLGWTELNNRFGGQALLNLAKADGGLIASTNAGKLFVSTDEGKRWQPLGGYPAPNSTAAQHGEKLFAANCQACHGDHGIGESPTPANTQRLAPALDETMHAWHHTDAQLENTILEGLPAPSRMQGWADRLSERDARDLIAYMKSLWDERALRCQGPKHMNPECRR